MNRLQKHINKNRRHVRIRAKISGTASRPRVAVFKSNRNLFIQFIDDAAGKTILSSQVVAADKIKAKGTKTEREIAVAKSLAEKAKAAGITEAIFDRGGFAYHGRVKAVADTLRENGIKL
ncbi:MAG TPA: 50S ribosomal protein L18 [Candidatus Paceibacterota bacterium]|nr:50S ribosomal protein L18 [Candidatus Paceibacterota bacterium]